ncbi:MAG: hypothetical protein ACJ8IR_13995 [Alphaproteobacteria bacterium]
MQKAFFMAVASACILLAVPPAHAAQIEGCHEVGRAAFIVEPWEQNSKTFYKGQIRVAYIDRGGEPVCCSAYLLILVPDRQSETRDRACYVISKKTGIGFAGIGFSDLRTSYDPRKGLLIVFPFTTMKGDGQTTERGMARVRINVATGKVIVE